MPKTAYYPNAQWGEGVDEVRSAFRLQGGEAIQLCNIQMADLRFNTTPTNGWKKVNYWHEKLYCLPPLERLLIVRHLLVFFSNTIFDFVHFCH